MYVSYFPQTISQWRSQGKSKHNRSNLPIKNLECDHVNISKNKNITPYLSPWNFVTDMVVSYQEKYIFFLWIRNMHVIGECITNYIKSWTNSKNIYLITSFGGYYYWVFLQVVLYFDKPVGQVKIQTKSKNTKQYCTPKHLKCVICYPTAFSMQSVSNHFLYGKKSKVNREA